MNNGTASPKNDDTKNPQPTPQTGVIEVPDPPKNQPEATQTEKQPKGQESQKEKNPGAEKIIKAVLAAASAAILTATAIQTQTLWKTPETDTNPNQTPAAQGETKPAAPEPEAEQTTTIAAIHTNPSDNLPTKPNQFLVILTAVQAINQPNPSRAFLTILLPSGKPIIAETGTKALINLIDNKTITPGSQAKITIGVLNKKARDKYKNARQEVSSQTAIPTENFFDTEEYEVIPTQPNPKQTPEEQAQEPEDPNNGNPQTPNPNPGEIFKR
jgi:hypothetical protein